MSTIPQTEERPGWLRCALSPLLGCAALWFAASHGIAAADTAVEPPETVAAPPAADAPMTVDQEDAERLRALGYVEFATDSGEVTDVGVTLFDPERSAPGHSLIVSSSGCSARLLDLEGQELHVWSQKRCRQWWGATLARNGDLLVNGSLLKEPRSPGAAGKRAKTKRFAARISWAGKTKWILMMRSHHQLSLTPKGELLVLIEAVVAGKSTALVRETLVEPADNSLTFHDNALKWLSLDGAVLESLSLLETVTTGDATFPFAELDKLMEGKSHVGLFHCNSAFSMDQPHLANTHALFSEHNVLLTSRNQNRIFIVNRKTRSLVWAWGEAELQTPHYATWLASGHILVFDNRVDRVGQSRIHGRSFGRQPADNRGNCAGQQLATVIQTAVALRRANL